MSGIRRLVSPHKIPEVNAFDASPEYGTLAHKAGILYMFSTVNGLDTWRPMNKSESVYIHTQGLAATTWTIDHQLASKEVSVTIYDENNMMVDASVSHALNGTGDWITTITATVPIAGYAVIFGPEFVGLGTTSNDIIADSVTIGGEPAVVPSDLTDYITTNDLIDLGVI